jgi:hypothetical protein
MQVNPKKDPWTTAHRSCRTSLSGRVPFGVDSRDPFFLVAELFLPPLGYLHGHAIFLASTTPGLHAGENT